MLGSRCWEEFGPVGCLLGRKRTGLERVWESYYVLGVNIFRKEEGSAEI